MLMRLRTNLYSLSKFIVVYHQKSSLPGYAMSEVILPEKDNFAKRSERELWHNKYHSSRRNKEIFCTI